MANPLNKAHCSATTITGKPCKNQSKQGSRFCWLHSLSRTTDARWYQNTVLQWITGILATVLVGWWFFNLGPTKEKQDEGLAMQRTGLKVVSNISENVNEVKEFVKHNPRPKKGLRLLEPQYTNSADGVVTIFRFGSEVGERIGPYSINLSFEKPYDTVARDFEYLTPLQMNGGFDGESNGDNTDRSQYRISGRSIYQSHLVLTFTARYKMEIKSLLISPPPED